MKAAAAARNALLARGEILQMQMNETNNLEMCWAHGVLNWNLAPHVTSFSTCNLDLPADGFRLKEVSLEVFRKDRKSVHCNILLGILEVKPLVVVNIAIFLLEFCQAIGCPVSERTKKLHDFHCNKNWERDLKSELSGRDQFLQEKRPLPGVFFFISTNSSRPF